jgi:tripartite-type tricarboxylate transporter receptor subunit TctC
VKVMWRGLLTLGVIVSTLLSWSDGASAQDFYKGKTITIVVGFGPGGGYDLTARLLARHMGRYIPGSPTIVVSNMPGASGIKSVNYLYAIAPRDGTVFGTFHSASPFYETMRMSGVQYKSAELSWIGNVSRSVNAVAVWHATGVRSLEDAKRTTVIMAAIAGGGIMDTYPRVLNNLFGTKFRIVSGYEGTNAVNIAIERGEVEGGTTAWNTWKVARPQWIKERKIIPLVQIGPEKDAELAQVPLLHELAQNEEQQQMFRLISGNVAMERPFTAPPKIPSDRLEILRRAFDQTTKDPAFLADALRMQSDVSPQTGEAVQAIVTSIVSTPAAVIDKLKINAGLN